MAYGSRSDTYIYMPWKRQGVNIKVFEIYMPEKARQNFRPNKIKTKDKSSKTRNKKVA